MIRQYSFERLAVWQNSRKLVKEVYCLVSGLPSEEKYGLNSQIKRAIISVSSSIAEGSSRTGSKEQAHFYQTAYSSLMEVLCQLTLCWDLELINEQCYQKIRESIDIVAHQLNQLRAAALSKSSEPAQLRNDQPSKPLNL